MAWLNLRCKELEFLNDEDGWYDGAGIIIECNLPYRESFREKELIRQGWDFRDGLAGQRVGNISIWSYAQMIAENNIGKSFDRAFSYFLKRTHHIENRHREFLDMFSGERRYRDFVVDSNGNIQYGEWRFWWKNKENNKEKPPYLFKSYDLETTFIHRIYGTERDKRQYYWSRKHRDQDYIEYVTSGYQIENVIPKSKLEKRLKYEYNQKKKQLQKYWDKERKNKVYSMLSNAEIELQKSRLIDENKLLSHGFDSESFKGEHYSGRKKKRSGII